MKKYTNTVTDRLGNALNAATVTVVSYPSEAAVTVYSDDGTTVIASSIITTNSLGEFSFYAPPGRYNLQVRVAGALVNTVTDVQIDEGISEEVASIAALKALKGMGTGQYSVRTLGYYSAGDGGGGSFYWDSASSATDNGGTIIAPDAGGVGRWRALGDMSDVRRWGAKGDDSTNNATAIQAAFDALDEIQIPDETYRFSTELTVTAAKKIKGRGRNSILRWSGSTASGAIQVGFQADMLRGVVMEGLQIDKTAGATAERLLHIRGVFESVFKKLWLGNNAASTGATNDNILTEKCWLNSFENVYSRRAGRYGMYMKAQTSYLTDASNGNMVFAGAFEDNVSAGIAIQDGEGNIILGNVFEDFAGNGQHGVLLNGRANFTKIQSNYFEETATTSNDIRVVGSNGNSFVSIAQNMHRGGPTTEVYLDYASNARVHDNASVVTGTYAQVTANTDRAWFGLNSCTSATTYVNDSGTNTIIWGDKAGSPVLTRAIMANNSPLQALDASNNIRTLAVLQASGAMNFGDANHNVYLDGASINFNAGLRSSFKLSTPAGNAQASSLWMGAGVPSNAEGSNGDFYFRSDGAGGANTTIYHKEAGAWVGLTN